MQKWATLLRSPLLLQFPDFYFAGVVTEFLFDDIQNDVPLSSAESTAHEVRESDAHRLLPHEIIIGKRMKGRSKSVIIGLSLSPPVALLTKQIRHDAAFRLIDVYQLAASER